MDLCFVNPTGRTRFCSLPVTSDVLISAPNQKFYLRLRGLENKDKGVAYSWLLLHRPIGGSFSLPAVISEKPRLALGLVVTGSDEGRICKDNVSGSETLEYDHVVALL